MSREHVTTGFVWARIKTKNSSGPEDTALLSKRSVKVYSGEMKFLKVLKGLIEGKRIDVCKEAIQKTYMSYL